ncbi:hypothetical protein YC2023_072725 [Brassica napus]
MSRKMGINRISRSGVLKLLVYFIESWSYGIGDHMINQKLGGENSRVGNALGREVGPTSTVQHLQLRPQLSLSFAGSTVQECAFARFTQYYVIVAFPSHYAVSSIDGSSQSRLCSPLTPSPHLIATLPKFSISQLYQLLSFRDCTVDDSMCSPTPAASLHSIATSGDISIFRDGFQLRSKSIRWVLQRQSRPFGVLSNAGSRTTSEDFLRKESLDIRKNAVNLTFSWFTSTVENDIQVLEN